MSSLPAHGRHIGAASMSVPGAVGVPGQAALSAGLTVQLTLVKGQLRHTLLGAHKQPLLEERGWVKDWNRDGRENNDGGGESRDNVGEPEEKNKGASSSLPCNTDTLTVTRKKKQIHLHSVSHKSNSSCINVSGHGECVFACGVENREMWGCLLFIIFVCVRAAVSFSFSPLMPNCFNNARCICVWASLHYCSDWGEVTMATGDEAVLGDARWRDEWEVRCYRVWVRQFGTLKASLVCYLFLWECHGCHRWFVLWRRQERETEKHTRFILKQR